MLYSVLKKSLCIMLCTLLVNSTSYASAQQAMISTSAVVQQLDRAETEQKVREFVGSEEVRKLLLGRGVSAEEVSSRLAGLSEQELQQLAGQVDHARAGGNILVVVLLVVLIIFLVKRI